MPGMVRIRDRSSRHWWLAPSSPTVRPAWVAQILTLACVYAMELRMISYALPAANIAKLLANTVLPETARPAAMPIMFASAMPAL